MSSILSVNLPKPLPVPLPVPFRNTISLATRHEDTPEGVYEIGIDECGRGPMFGRLYAAAVILPIHSTGGDNSDSFAHHLMRDSKKITSRARRAEIAQYIRDACVAYSIQYVEHDTIDRVNVLQANMQAMHACVRDVIGRSTDPAFKYTLLVDGNYFKPCSVVVEEELDAKSDDRRSFDFGRNGGEPFLRKKEAHPSLVYVPYTTIEGGDNRYSAIAAASILAKDAHDTWIDAMCDQHPALEERYGMRSHVGYGTRRHLDGIATHGITQWHRRTFGLCKTAPLNPI